jgi:hypothetical protein
MDLIVGGEDIRRHNESTIVVIIVMTQTKSQEYHAVDSWFPLMRKI